VEEIKKSIGARSEAFNERYGGRVKPSRVHSIIKDRLQVLQVQTLTYEKQLT